MLTPPAKVEAASLPLFVWIKRLEAASTFKPCPAEREAKKSATAGSDFASAEANNHSGRDPATLVDMLSMKCCLDRHLFDQSEEH